MGELAAQLPSFDVQGLVVHHSVGAEVRANEIGSRAERVLSRLRSVFGSAPHFDVYVVGPTDWAAVGEGVPYGMPLAVPGKVVAPLDAAEWVIEHFRGVPGVPEALTDQAEITAFIDTVVAHEVTHLTESFDQTTWASSLGPMWVSELYANVGMYGYLAEEEPKELDRVVQFAEASLAAGAESWPVHELDRMPESLQYGPGNYVWFQMLLILLAKQLWEAAGSSALRAYRDAFDGKGLTSAEVVTALDRIAPGLGEQVRRWPSL